MSTETIERDLVCRGCGYNLRSLPANGICPECAVPVGFSLLPDSLSLNEPGHFQTARLGVLLIIGVACWEVLDKSLLILPAANLPNYFVQWVRPYYAHSGILYWLAFIGQAFALYTFTAIHRTTFRRTSLVICLVAGFFLLRFCVGWAGRSYVCPLNQLAFDPIFNSLWLGYGAKFAREYATPSLAKQINLLRWMLPAAMVICLVVIFSQVPELFPVFDAAAVVVICLNVYLIILFVRLRTALVWQMPAEGGIAAHVLEAEAGIATGDSQWRQRVRWGLTLEGIYAGVILLVHVVSFVGSRLQRFGASVPMTGTRIPDQFVDGGVLLLSMITGALQLLGIWWISMPTAEQLSAETTAGEWMPRQLLRFFSGCAVAISLINPICDVAALREPAIVYWLPLLTRAVMLFCLFHYFEREAGAAGGIGIDSQRGGDREMGIAAAGCDLAGDSAGSGGIWIFGWGCHGRVSPATGLSSGGGNLGDMDFLSALALLRPGGCEVI